MATICKKNQLTCQKDVMMVESKIIAMANTLKTIDKNLLDRLSADAGTSSRLRQNHNLHELPDRVQRMLNAIEPDSYVRPHRHLYPPKVEVFIALRGRGAAFSFDSNGEIIACVALSPDGDAPASTPCGALGVEFQPGEWHTIVSFEKGTIFFEAKDGPYDRATDKEFAPWAPDENSLEAGAYLKRLKSRVKR